MGSERKNGRRRTTVLLAGALAASGALVGLSAGGAGATEPDCAGEQVFVVPGGSVEMHDDPGFDVVIFDLGMTLEAGTYTMQTKGFDGFAGRSEAPDELSERWMAEFLDAEDNEVGESGATTDVPDDVEYAESVDNFSVVLSAPATRVRLVMVKDFQSRNMFHITCLGLNRLPDPTTTTSTTPSSTTTSTVATTTTAAPTTTSAAPTTAPPTTAAAAVAAATLPVTGSDTQMLVIAGVTATMLGASLMLRSRRHA